MVGRLLYTVKIIHATLLITQSKCKMQLQEVCTVCSIVLLFCSTGKPSGNEQSGCIETVFIV